MDPWLALVAVGALLTVVGLVAVFKVQGGHEHSFKLAGVIEISSTGTGVFLAALGIAALFLGLRESTKQEVRVTDVSLVTDTGQATADYYVKCPINVALEGSLSVSGDPGTISYRLDREDGLDGPVTKGAVKTLAFDRPDTKTVRFDIPVTIPEGQVYFESILRVIDPTTAESDPVRVTVICDPTLPDGPPSPPPDVEPPPSE